jgi:hypothetical protein
MAHERVHTGEKPFGKALSSILTLINYKIDAQNFTIFVKKFILIFSLSILRKTVPKAIDNERARKVLLPREKLRRHQQRRHQERQPYERF